LRVSIPFIAGQWSLPSAGASPVSPSFVRVSIPFIAGQWSLPSSPCSRRVRANPFQSPSLRGSGRFPRPTRTPRIAAGMFQSPSLRGSGRFTRLRHVLDQDPDCFNPLHCGAVVASRRKAEERAEAEARFNPLHCGAVVASECV